MKIEKNVPIPEMTGGRPKVGIQISDETWDKMRVGDSIFVPLEAGRDIRKESGRLGQQRSRAQYRLGRKFTLRTLDDGWRIWRIA